MSFYQAMCSNTNTDIGVGSVHVYNYNKHLAYIINNNISNIMLFLLFI